MQILTKNLKNRHKVPITYGSFLNLNFYVPWTEMERGNVKRMQRGMN